MPGCQQCSFPGQYTKDNEDCDELYRKILESISSLIVSKQ